MIHDGGETTLVPAKVVTTWPKGSFAESLAIDPDGVIFVSLHTDKAVVRVDPATGAVTPFASFDRPATGLAFMADGTLVVSGGAPGQAPGVLWRVSPSGEVAPIAEIADAAFLNGLTPLGRHVLVCDSLGGAIYACDPTSGSVSRWLADPLLTPPTPAEAPGANGIKLFGGDVTISVTGADRLVRAPVRGEVPGSLKIIAERLRADDFCFDTAGAAYIGTHPAKSLVRLAPDGRRSTLAEAADGMVGSTAVAFGRTAADRHCVYVTTTGGTMTVPDDRLEPAKLVRVEVGGAGHPLLPGQPA